jgi:hypothetical protein
MDDGLEEVINIDSDVPKSVDFGTGIELLMNDKKKSNNDSTPQNNENELLNEITDIDNIGMSSSNLDTDDALKPINIGLSASPSNDFGYKELNLGKDTSNLQDTFGSNGDYNTDKTWDGYGKLDDVNVSFQEPIAEKKSKEELLKEKFEYLRKLEALEKKGVELTKKYSMDSDLNEMKGEYENIIAEKERKNSLQFQGKVLTTLITGLEFLNNRFDPFDVKLDGWSEQVNENLDDYDEIFSELHEKYKSKAKMAPEIKLLFNLVTSGVMIHMTNTMFKSSMPGMDDIMRQNPDLMNQFTQAAVNSMGRENPGLGNFMNEFGTNNSQQPPMNNIREKSNIPQQRPEMKGPETENIDDVLKSLNKKINVNDDTNSTISVEDVSELSKLSSASNSSSRRRKKSEKNTISLAL